MVANILEETNCTYTIILDYTVNMKNCLLTSLFYTCKTILLVSETKPCYILLL